MAGVTGDFPALRALVDQLGQLHGAALKAHANKLLGQAALTEIALGFEEGRDPYGRTWAPLLGRQGQPLLDTGRLARSFGSTASAKGFVIDTNVVYAGIHQAGGVITAKSAKGLRFKVGDRWVTKRTVTIPKRQMVPEGDLGPLWSATFEEELAAAVEANFT